MTTTAETELAFAGPVALAALVRAGTVSPRELTELFLSRIEALDPRLNAFRVVLADEALAAADAMTEPSGPLAGVPIAIKDDQPLTGQVATRGSRAYGPPATQDAEPIRRLRAAGAIPIGITNTPELLIFPWTATQANGITRNPWRLDRSPGRLVGWLGGRGRRRPGRSRDRLGRRRLDPHPGGQLRAGRDEADARTRVLGTRRPGLARHVGDRRAGPNRGRQRAAARRDARCAAGRGTAGPAV